MLPYWDVSICNYHLICCNATILRKRYWSIRISFIHENNGAMLILSEKYTCMCTFKSQNIALRIYKDIQRTLLDICLMHCEIDKVDPLRERVDHVVVVTDCLIIWYNFFFLCVAAIYFWITIGIEMTEIIWLLDSCYRPVDYDVRVLISVTQNDQLWISVSETSQQKRQASAAFITAIIHIGKTSWYQL